MDANEKARRNAYKKVSGQKIRCQYFNQFIYCIASVPVIVSLICGILDLKTGRFSFSGWLGMTGKAVFTTVIIILPVVVLSLLNRHFFGSVVCVLNSDGIYCSGGYIDWNSVISVEYVAEPHGRNMRRRYCRAVVHCKDKQEEIKHAPLYILGKIKKIAPNVKTSFSKDSKTTIIVIAALCAAMCVVMCFVK